MTTTQEKPHVVTSEDVERLRAEVAQMKRDLKAKEHLLNLATFVPEGQGYMVSTDRYGRVKSVVVINDITRKHTSAKEGHYNGS